ncbi:uncharacterized protein N7515_000454 [Penicillium bovifimosum]|uniref:Uncharacterized protein n=1 Tax=Penicillium bovifimosum TaxID=126998 RepID=A0A9W9HHC3_9EURO|nr:uncharacterized protein N7515_000454 [Penicillium bovifimosum]KAJ5145890.1 hypothetical protein N7515_000454 [Penicillium bovifimosum]
MPGTRMVAVHSPPLFNSAEPLLLRQVLQVQAYSAQSHQRMETTSPGRGSCRQERGDHRALTFMCASPLQAHLLGTSEE